MFRNSLICRALMPALFLAALFCLNAQARGAAHPQRKVVTDRNNNGSITLYQGDTLVVRLRANPSTGYSWQSGLNDPFLLQPIGTPAYVRPRSRLIGASGHQVFRFKAVSVGASTLQFSYWRGMQPSTRTFQILVVVTAPPSGMTNVVTVTDRNNNGHVTLSQGDTLVVRLSANPSTGYSWQVGQDNAGLLAPLGRPIYQRPQSARPGAGGYQAFQFQAVAPGGVGLKLLYQRPWLGGVPAAKTYQILVTIRR